MWPHHAGLETISARLAEMPRHSLLLRYQVILETLRDLLAAAVPALAHALRAGRTPHCATTPGK